MDLVVQEEKVLIGSILQKPDSLTKVSSVLKAEEFISAEARAAYSIMLEIWSSRESVDVFSIVRKDPKLASYVSTAKDDGVGFGIEKSARQVALNAKEHRIRKSLKQMVEGRVPISDMLQGLHDIYKSEIHVETKSPSIDSVLERFGEVQATNRERGSIGYKAGFSFLDDNHIQYCPGHIWLLGGYTSVGKTAMLIQLIVNMLARDDCPMITVISTEMTEQQILSRIIANITGVHSYRVLSGNYHHGEEEHVEACLEMLKRKPLKIYDDVYRLQDIENVLRREYLQGGVDVAALDYVQNVQVLGASSSYEASSQAAKCLQQLAKDTESTLLCLSQVSNSVGRGDTEQLEFKGGGEWAAVADVGIQLRRNKKDKYALLFQIKKNRHGPLLEQKMEFKSDFTKIMAMPDTEI